jgi:hypothetical protein
MEEYVLFHDHCTTMLLDHEEHAREVRSKAAARREAIRAAKRWSDPLLHPPLSAPRHTQARHDRKSVESGPERQLALLRDKRDKRAREEAEQVNTP